MEKSFSDQIGKVHFYNGINQIEQIEGKAERLNINGYEKHLQLGSTNVRLDKIITIFGMPGPAYSTYERYLNACITCENLN